jgi:hypothetical protein
MDAMAGEVVGVTAGEAAAVSVELADAVTRVMISVVIATASVVTRSARFLKRSAWLENSLKVFCVESPKCRPLSVLLKG